MDVSDKPLTQRGLSTTALFSGISHKISAAPFTFLLLSIFVHGKATSLEMLDESSNHKLSCQQTRSTG